MRQVYSVLYRRPVPLRPAFDFTIPSWMLKTHGDTIYDKLSDLRGITGLRFNHWRQPHPSEGFGPVATVVPFERVTIDSLRLQQLIFKQPAPIVLRVSDHTFSPIDTPLDLTGKLLFFELQCTELTRDAARGLPILKSWQQLTVRSSHIDENAVDILLERLQGDKLFLEHCIMNAKTHARLAAIKRVALVTPNVYEDDPVMPSEAAAAGPPENPASSNP